MKIIYKVHIWTSLLASIFLLLLIISGAILLYRPALANWNTLGGLELAEKPLGRSGLWAELTNALNAVERKFPGRGIKQVTVDTRFSRLNISLAPPAAGDAFAGKSGAAKISASSRNANRYIYSPHDKTLVAAAKAEYRSEFLRSFLNTAHIVHIGRWFGVKVTFILVCACILTIVSVISGFLLYAPPSRRQTAEQNTPSAISPSQYYSGVHKLFGLIAGVFVLLFALSGILQLVSPSHIADFYKAAHSAAEDHFAREIAAADEIGERGEAIMPSEALRLVAAASPEKNILAVDWLDGDGARYAFYLNDNAVSAARHIACEVLYLSADGRISYRVAPPASLRFLNAFANLHRCWASSSLLKIIWLAYLGAAFILVWSGIKIHILRHRPPKTAKEYFPPWQDLSAKIIAACSLSVALGLFVIPHFEYIAIMLLIAPLIAIAYFSIKKETAV